MIVGQNELSNLGLTGEQVRALVKYLMTGGLLRTDDQLQNLMRYLINGRPSKAPFSPSSEVPPPQAGAIPPPMVQGAPPPPMSPLAGMMPQGAPVPPPPAMMPSAGAPPVASAMPAPMVPAMPGAMPPMPKTKPLNKSQSLMELILKKLIGPPNSDEIVGVTDPYGNRLPKNW